MTYCKAENGKIYQLQRCPFCGMDVAEVFTQSEAKEYDPPLDEEHERYTIVCSFNRNGCGATCGFHSTIAKAVSRWNTRVVI